MKIGNVSFGSTYAVKYNHILMKAYGYASPKTNVREFIDTYNSYVKEKDEVSAINPETNTYFIKMNDEKDSLFEELQANWGIKGVFKKVKDNNMSGATVTSVGRTKNEIGIISDKISRYERYKQLENESFIP